jgi:hypothetical protein
VAVVGVPPFDPGEGGYSKWFAFGRWLQSPEERSSAGYVTGKALIMARLGALAAFCESLGDEASARLLTEIADEERRYYEQGKGMLAAAAATEESQARGRRAAYRTLELATETAEPLQLRKALGRRR